MMRNNYLLPKIFGSVAISAVMVIGVYVLIIDLPRNNQQQNVTVSEPSQNKEKSLNVPSPKNETASSAQDITDQSLPATAGTNTNGSASTGSSLSAPPPTAPTTPIAKYAYNSNTYTKSKTYDIPDLSLSWTLTATISIDKDIVTSVTTEQPTSGKSQQYYNNFATSLSGEVVGKNIDSLNIGKLANATYTSDAFNAILNLVRSAAKK